VLFGKHFDGTLRARSRRDYVREETLIGHEEALILSPAGARDFREEFGGDD
jgi:hypothetical protein